MTRTRKFILAIVVVVVGVIGWIASDLLHTLHELPNAYAAWDAGTLVVQYMKSHDDQWPRSWDDLQNLHEDDGQPVMLRGASGDHAGYVRRLRERVAIDWQFDPRDIAHAKPISKPGGAVFAVVWAGAEPNEIVRDYLAERAAARQATRSGNK